MLSTGGWILIGFVVVVGVVCLVARSKARRAAVKPRGDGGSSVVVGDSKRDGKGDLDDTGGDADGGGDGGGGGGGD